MSRDPRDWQEDMDMFEEGIEQSRKLGFRPTIETSPYQVTIYWLQQSKQLKEDNAHLTVQMYADANRYQVQAVEIAELRKELRYALTVKEDFVKGLRIQEGRADKAEEREQKLKEAVQTIVEIGPTLMDELVSDDIVIKFQDLLATLYPLDKEDTSL